MPITNPAASVIGIRSAVGSLRTIVRKWVERSFGGAGEWTDAMAEPRGREPKGDFSQRAKSFVDSVTRAHEEPDDEEELDLSELRQAADAALARAEESLRRLNPHPNARRLIKSRSASEALAAQERALEAGEVLDSGQGRDSSALLQDRLSKEMALKLPSREVGR